MSRQSLNKATKERTCFTALTPLPQVPIYILINLISEQPRNRKD